MNTACRHEMPRLLPLTITSLRKTGGLMLEDQTRSSVEDCASSINPITVRLSYYRNERLEWRSSLVCACLVSELERWRLIAGRFGQCLGCETE